MSNFLVKLIITPLLFLLKLHYLVIYYTSSKIDKGKIKADLSNGDLKRDPNIIDMLYRLHTDKYFKTLFFHRTKENIFSKIFYTENERCFIIPKDVTIGRNLTYDHPYGTILNAKEIGNNFHCKHLTTIGNKNDDENLRPIIGNNVYVGANVNIIGPIKIGNNVIIGAGTTVTKSVPDNQIIVNQKLRSLQ